ncbi:TonB-dependent receptor [Sphingomonas sp. Tas61C01]|uniref:TonB-dependent receptor n=1 Tax=Sphingomonas sp. Tas61C01 TaxID=3458297 RepID=UPI00403EA73D
MAIDKGVRRFRIMGSAVSALLLATGSIALSTAAHAQGFSSFSATGIVVDDNGKPIANATVTARSDDQGFSRSARTNKSGSYTLPELREGQYTFSIEVEGYAPYSESGVRLATGSAGNEFRLASIGTSGDILVTGRRVATSEFDLTTTGQVINVADVATRIPVARSLAALIQLVPGTSAGSGAFNNLSSVNGGAVSENAFFINGLNITDFRKGLSPVEVPFEFYQTIEVKTGGYAAEFGRTTGGFTSATSKSGSNEFHGGLLMTWNPNGLRSNRPNTFFSDNNGGASEYRSVIAQLSGPIIKDHLFFYGLYQARNNTSSAAGKQFLGDPRNQSQVDDPAQYLGTSRSYSRSDTPFYAAKIDAIITDGQRLEFTYFNTRYRSNTSTFGTSAGTLADRYNYRTNSDGPYTGGSKQTFGGANYVGRYTGVFTNWLTLSAAYGRNENIASFESFNATNVSTPSVIDSRDPLRIVPLTIAGGGRGSDLDVRKFYRADADLRFKMLGSHHIRFGYDREALSSTSFSQGTGEGLSYNIFSARAGNIYGLAPGTQYVRQTRYFQAGQFASSNEAFYIQDSWSLISDRLNLNVGIRNDRFSNDNASAETFYKSGNQWGPRLGFTFDPIGERRDKIYGSFSRMYLPVASNTNIRLTGGEFFYTRTNLFGGLGAGNIPILGAPVLYPTAGNCPDDNVRNCSVTGDGKPKDAETTVARDLMPQSEDEFILGYEKRLGAKWRVGAFFNYSKLNEVLEDSAIDAAVNNYCKAEKITGCDSVWDGFHQYVLINPGRGASITLSDPVNGEQTLRTVAFTPEQLGYPKAERTYKAMTFEAHREFDGVWSLDASYTFSKTIGNYEGGVKTDNGQSDTGLTTDFDQPGLTLGTYGYSPNDKRHVIKLAGSYQIGPVNVGGVFQAYAPRRYGCIGQVPIGVDRYAAAYGASGLFCQVRPDGSINTEPNTTTPVALIRRGSVFKSDWLFINDVDVAYKFNVGKASMTLRASVFNVLNRKAKLNFNETGTNDEGVANPYYRTPTEYQSGRNARLQLAFNF